MIRDAAYDRVCHALTQRVGPGRNGSWRCPAHDDHNPSLSIKATDDGVLVHCHAGCSQEDVVTALGLSMADLFDVPKSNGDGKPTIETTYAYTNDAGKLLFEVVRYQPKMFRQRRPDGRGGWVWNLQGARRVLFRLPQVLDAKAQGRTIYVVEGEKDVLAVETAGEVATTNPGGAGKWLDAYTPTLAGYQDVVVVADRDKPGIAHTHDVAAKLRAAGCGVRVCQPPEGSKDIAQHLALGGQLDDLVPLDEPAEPIREPTGLRLTPASEIGIDRVHWVWNHRIPVGGTTLLAGREGFGKTLLVCWLAARLSRGDLPGEWQGRPSDVIYIGSEDDRKSVVNPRLKAAGADLSRFHFVDIGEGGVFSVNVDTDALRSAAGKLNAQGRTVALIVLDPLDSHLSGTDTHRKAEVQASVAKLAVLSQQLRCGALGLGHFNKSDIRDLLRLVVGSVGFTTSVRSVLGVGSHPQNPDERVCVLGKTNLVGDSEVSAIRFKPEKVYLPHPDGGKDIDTARVAILGQEYGIDPNSILPGSVQDRSATEEAIQWLHSMLSDGEMSKRDVVKAARDEGHSTKVLRIARERLNVQVTRDDDTHGRPSRWVLPLTCPLVTCPDRRAHKPQGSHQDKHPDSAPYVPKFGIGHVTPEPLPVYNHGE